MMIRLIQLFVFFSFSTIFTTLFADYPPNYPVIPQEVINLRAQVKPAKSQPALPVIPLSEEAKQFKIPKSQPQSHLQPQPQLLLHTQPHSQQLKSHSRSRFINITPGKIHPVTRYTIFPGSLRWNVTHIAHHFGWRTVVWVPHYDFRWVGNRMAISGKCVEVLMAKLLTDYPLQAVFYTGNHVLVITPRTLK